MPPKMTANPLKPSRHRAGKPTGADSSDSDASDDEAVAPQTQTQPKPKPKPRQQTAPRPVGGAGKVIISGGLSAAGLNQRQAQAEQDEARRKARIDLEQRAAEEGFVTESESGESESDEEEESGTEDSSSEEVESSEDEAPRRLRPKFIPKSQRDGPAAGTAAKARDKEDEDEEAALAAEEARKKAATDEMVEEQIRKDAAARAAGKKHWDDDEDEADDVDTEDDVEPEAEYAAWKLRELKRIKRAREKTEARERELEETERRRNLTEEERRAEDDEYIAKQREEKEGRGKMAYLQRYYHKGAYFQDEAKAQGLDKRDIMGARFADDIRNRDLLPKALQMRDMTKLGKKGATKYRDLKSEDTGRWGQFDDPRPGRGGYDKFGDERFQPDHRRDGDGDGGRGANAIPLGDRKRVPGAPDGPRNDRSGSGADGYRGGGHRPDDEGRERLRSRSRSPRRDHHRDDYRDRRKRSSSRDRDQRDSDKRRRIEA